MVFTFIASVGFFRDNPTGVLYLDSTDSGVKKVAVAAPTTTGLQF
jgi:hypothetical protein